MENYYLVFRIDHTSDKGRELSRLKEVHDYREILMGFCTKRSMAEFVKEYESGMSGYVMLKPVS